MITVIRKEKEYTFYINRRVYYHIEEPLSEEIFATVIEQYELWSNGVRYETDINHHAIKAAGTSQRRTFR